VGNQHAAPPMLDLFGPGMFGDEAAPVAADRRHARRGRLRGRHIRPLGYSRVPIAPAPTEVISLEEHLVLHVLRQRCVDLDAVQVATQAALPPSVAVATLHELVRSGLARDVLVGNRLRFGLP
jgi:hypothetical protein